MRRVGDVFARDLVTPDRLIMTPPSLHFLAAKPHVNTMGYDNCGGCGSYNGRRYMTKDERTQMLKEYQGELENELQGVKERIAEIAAE
ncbi:MAG: hypothetical protein ABR562_04030 [Thermoplasmatota archaeon]|nr:hypothetical protein [Halobacteriales archaeon]